MTPSSLHKDVPLPILAPVDLPVYEVGPVQRSHQVQGLPPYLCVGVTRGTRWIPPNDVPTQFMPQELPVDFPCAIRRVLLTKHPLPRQHLIDVALQSVMLSLVSQELMFLAMVLQQQRDLLVEDTLRRELVVQVHMEGSAIQARSLFMSGMIQTSDRIADSNVANLAMVHIDDPEFPLPVSFNELD